MSDNLNNRNDLPEGSSPPNNNTDEESSGTPILCKVCGGAPKGTHYGVVSCGACRKCFLFYLKEGKEFGQCKKNGKCMDEPTVKNRKQCGPCRLQKCKDVGMGLELSRRGRPPKAKKENMLGQKVRQLAKDSTSASVSHPSSVDSAVAHCSSRPPSTQSSGLPIVCEVCGATPCRYVFGAFACEACKLFFPRCMRRINKVKPCNNNGKCKDELSEANRAKCRLCRLNKCLDVGMNLQGRRMGRLRMAEKEKQLRQKRQKQANQSTSASVSHPSSVDSAVAHCSSRPPTSSVHNVNKDPNSERKLSVIVCPKRRSNSWSCGLDPPCGGSGISSQAGSSLARSDQGLHYDYVSGYGNLHLEDTMSTGVPQAPSLMDSNNDEDLYVSTRSSSSSEQQESKAEGPLDLSKKE